MNLRTPPCLRVARPSRDLAAARHFYARGLGLQVLVAFEDHEGFDGVVFGGRTWPYEIEFTRHRRAVATPAPTEEDLLVFYLSDRAEWESAVRRLRAIDATEVSSPNPYWERGGITFRDADGYRVVLYNASAIDR